MLLHSLDLRVTPPCTTQHNICTVCKFNTYGNEFRYSCRSVMYSSYSRIKKTLEVPIMIEYRPDSMRERVA